MESFSLRNIVPASTDTTVVTFENTVVFATGRYVFAKFKHKNAITDENIPRYKIEKRNDASEKLLNIFTGLSTFSKSDIRTKDIIPITVMAYVRSNTVNSVESFLLAILYPTDDNTAPESNTTPRIDTVPSACPDKTVTTTPITDNAVNTYCIVVGFSPSMKIPQIIETIGIIEIIIDEKELVVICMPYVSKTKYKSG